MKANAKDRAAHKRIDAIAASAHEAIDWAAETTNHATDSLSSTGHELKETQERWVTTGRNYVQENPATSVGAALAGGYLLGRILFRARR